MILALLYVFQERLLFLPTALEQDFEYQFTYNFEELFLKTNDGAILNAIHFKVENPKGVILYFHGNADNLSRWGAIVEPFVERRYDVLIMDYRAYGKSIGKLSEASFYNDAKLFYNYLKQGYNEQVITLYGRSLGTAMATYLASKNKPKQLILETPYYSMTDVAQLKFPIFPVKQLLNYKFPSFEFIPNVNCPITIFHGTQDEVVPFSSAKKLVTVSPKLQTTFIAIEEGNHNNLMEYRAYQSEIDNLFP